MTKGEEAGTTDLVVDVTEKRRFSTKLLFHNGGSRYVSKEIVGPITEFYDVFKPGDNLSVKSFFGSPPKNLILGLFTYSFPINRYDTQLFIELDYSEFHARRDIADLGIKGHSEIATLGLSHPAIRTYTQRLDLKAFFDYKNIRSYTLDQQSSYDRLRVLSLEMDYSMEDQFKGRNYLRSTVSAGIPRLMGGLESEDNDSSRLGAGWRFAKFVIDANRMQAVPFNSFLIFRNSWQFASDPLPAAEEFYLGGMDTVRGFPQAEFLGDQGVVVSTELRMPPFGLIQKKVPFLKERTFRDFMQLALFVDHGKASRKAILAGEKKDQSLTGIGAGLRFFPWEDSSVSMDWGFPISAKESSNGDDSAFYIKVQMKFL